MAGDSDERIIRYEMSMTAATGEGERYVTDAGRVWKPLPPFVGPRQTGEVRGVKIGDTIRPDGRA